MFSKYFYEIKIAEIVRKDLFDTLNEFCRKVLEPRFDRIEKRLNEHEQKFRDIFNSLTSFIKGTAKRLGNLSHRVIE